MEKNLDNLKTKEVFNQILENEINRKYKDYESWRAKIMINNWLKQVDDPIDYKKFDWYGTFFGNFIDCYQCKFRKKYKAKEIKKMFYDKEFQKNIRNWTKEYMKSHNIKIEENLFNPARFYIDTLVRLNKEGKLNFIN